MKKKTTRIYYGTYKSNGTPAYWKVKVVNATQKVVIDGTLKDALKGHPGATVGCHLSYCAQANEDAFPHPCLLVAFTKATALVVSEIRDGQPVKAVKYNHSYGDLVELNDKDVNKGFIKAHPELAETQFVLRPPAKSHGSNGERTTPPKKTENGDETEDTPRVIVPRGAFKRANDAGLVSPSLEVAVK